MTKPNIVVILADDLGWRDLGCYGSSFYETPRIDALAATGALFTDAYAAAPVCSPSRASLMTGKYPVTVGVTDWIGAHAVGRLCDVPYFAHLPLSERSLAQALGEDGYRTWHIGKWHLGGALTWPDKHGFDVNLGGCEWGQPQSWTSPYACPTLSDGAEGEYLTDRLTDEAIALIREHDPDDGPFFLNLWHYAVHTPLVAPDHLVKKYVAKAKELRLDRVDPLEVGEEMPAWHRAGSRVERRTIQSHPTYAAMIENLDANVGRLLDALEQTGQAEETVVIFTSDNGGLSTSESSPTSNAPLAEGKGWMYDGGIRVPLIIRWPRCTSEGATISVPTTTPDLYATVLDIVDAPLAPHQHVDGISLVPLLDLSSGPSVAKELDERPLFWHYPHYGNQGGTPAASIRVGDWKLIRFYEDERKELYDLSTDISEEHDRAADSPELVERFSSQLDQWLTDTNALIPLLNPRYVG